MTDSLINTSYQGTPNQFHMMDDKNFLFPNSLCLYFVCSMDLGDPQLLYFIAHSQKDVVPAES